MTMTTIARSLALALFASLFVAADSLEATLIDNHTTTDYLLVGRGSEDDGVAVQVGSSNTLGRMFNVPSSSDPDVDDNPPNPIPANGTLPTANVTTNDGNVAVTHPNGVYNFQDINIHADIGIRC